MKIKDGFASLMGREDTIIEIDSLKILSEDGREMFGLSLDNDGKLSITSGSVCKFNGVLLDDSFSIKPVASNLITISKDKYQKC